MNKDLEMLEDVWEAIIRGPIFFGGNPEDRPPPDREQKIAAALLPLFLCYVDFDQQGTFLQRKHYLMLGALKRLAKEKDKHE